METLPLQAYIPNKSVYPGENIEVKVHLPNIITGTSTNINLSENLLLNGDFTNNLTNIKKNQNVNFDVTENNLTITSLQNTSTPGMLFASQISVTQFDRMILKYKGRVDNNNYFCSPFIRGLKSSDPTFKNTILWGNDDYMNDVVNTSLPSDIQLNSTEKSVEVMFNIPEGINKLLIYFLFSEQQINDKMYLDYVNLFKIIGNNNPNNLILNSNFTSGLTYWINNNNVNLSVENNILNMTTSVATTTPGIEHTNIVLVTPGQKYVLKYRAYTENNSYTVCPFINGYNNFVPTEKIVWTSSQYLKNIVNITDITDIYLTSENVERTIEFIIPSGTTQLLIYMLYGGGSTRLSVKIEYMSLFIDPNSEPIPNSIPEYNEVNLSILNKKKNLISFIPKIVAKQQTYVKNAFAVGCNWDTTFTYKVPMDLKPDLYFIEIIDKFCNYFYVEFIVKSPIYNSDILVLSNINTQNAYNTWAGLDGIASFYKWDINTDDGVQYKSNNSGSNYVSLDRPNFQNDSYIKNYNPAYKVPVWATRITGELYLLNWLDKTSINYHLINDIDLTKNQDIILNYKIFIIHCHPEYWSKEMMIALNKFRNAGGKIMYLGGNGLYWRVTFNNNIMEVRKDSSNHSHDNLKGGLWKNLESLISPYKTTQSLVGVWYKNITSADDVFGSPYKVLKPDHWVFSGVVSELVGKISLNSPTNKYNEGKSGASGFETDKVIIDEFKDKIIAIGDNPYNKGADMVYFEKNGGKVFSVGSIAYTGSLLVDDDISKLTKNVINYFSLPDNFFQKYTAEEIKSILIKLQ